MDYGIYPLTVVADRYRGCYSGGKWTAWNMDPDSNPYGPLGDDTSCLEFWSLDHTFPVGIGGTPDEAVQNLKEKMEG